MSSLPITAPDSASGFVTCDLLDAHPDCQVLAPVVTGLRWQHFGGKTCFYGQVETVSCHEDNSRVKELLATAGAGRVLVVDGGASMRCALMGDLIAESAVANGWSGVLIHGCVRDVQALCHLQLGVMALACIPQKSQRRGAGETGLALQFGGIHFQPGQWLYADANGVLISDQALALD